MIIKADTAAQYSVINLDSVRAIGIYDDTNGNYFTLNFSFIGGSDIVWKYDNQKQRDDKFKEISDKLSKV